MRSSSSAAVLTPNALVSSVASSLNCSAVMLNLSMYRYVFVVPALVGLIYAGDVSLPSILSIGCVSVH